MFFEHPHKPHTSTERTRIYVEQNYQKRATTLEKH
jgi:hypothetical protein